MEGRAVTRGSPLSEQAAKLPLLINRRRLMASGMIDVSSRYSVPETLARLQSILKEKGIVVFRPHRPQRRGGEGRPQNAADAVTDLRQSERWHAFDGCRAQAGYRPSVESTRVARRAGQGVAFLQFTGIPAAASRLSRRPPEKHRRNPCADSEGCMAVSSGRAGTPGSPLS